MIDLVSLSLRPGRMSHLICQLCSTDTAAQAVFVVHRMCAANALYVHCVMLSSGLVKLVSLRTPIGRQPCIAVPGRGITSVLARACAVHLLTMSSQPSAISPCFVLDFLSFVNSYTQRGRHASASIPQRGGRLLTYMSMHIYRCQC